jgi:hypothetical protein
MPWDVIPPRSKDMAVHAVLLPGGTHGKILYFGGYRVDDTHLFDVDPPYDDSTIADIAASASPGYNIFCGGHAFLADGRVLVGGGQLHLYDPNGIEIPPPPSDDPGDIEHAIHGGMTWGGERRCSIFNPLAQTWREVSPMSLDPAGNPDSGGRWYPTLCTLANGEVLAVGGHPDLREDYPSVQAHRHANNVPERYTPSSDTWTLLGDDPPATDQKTSADPDWGYDFQRTHVLPNGRVFFANPVRGKNRYYDPWAGEFLNSPVIDLSPDNAYGSISATWTSVMLPLLYQEGYRPRVLLMGGETAQRIDLGVQNPSWQQAGNRDWNATPPLRRFVCPVILPTGQVFFSGGTSGSGGDQPQQDAPVRQGEIYDPGIDWTTGHYSGTGDWSTVESASVTRHYHSVALLLPDGNVWTAGSNGPSEEGGGRELRIEIYQPPYASQSGRPTITSAPRNIGYLYQIVLDTPQANSIARVALIRCGSCTHGFNPDQRYIGLPFLAVDNNTLTITTPPNGNVAPPGYYMIWIIDNLGRPCRWAPIIRLSKQKCYFTADISTYSIHEVDALGTPANFNNALYLVFDSFLPDEIGNPTLSLSRQNGSPVPDMSVALGAPQFEGNLNVKDIAQRVVYPVHLSFSSTDAFDLIPGGDDFMDVDLHGSLHGFSCMTRLTLSKNPNPRMSDGNPHWLSVDLRAFRTKPGEAFTAGVNHGTAADAPHDYIKSVLSAYNGWMGGQPHPFDELPTDQESNRLALYSEDDTGDPVYNYGVARVRFRAPEGVDAVNVRVFFRQWTTGWTHLEYTNPFGANGSYRRLGDGANATPLLGLTGGEINNVPCFADPRTANMNAQTDPANRRTLKGNGAEEVHGYFGCWLDINQDVPRFPLEPQGSGPFQGDLLSIQELMRGLHQCLVAEIHYTLDPIQNGATPASSDNLAQRNILLDDSDNPGGFAAHIVHHTFEIKASPVSFPPPQLAESTSAATTARLHPDELAIHWGQLPRDSQVTLYAPQMDVDQILRYDALRPSPGNLAKAGPGALSLKVSDVTFVPLPGPLAKNIASLLSVQLPPTVTSGERFTVVVRQVDGRRLRVVGTTQFDIRVRTAPELRPRWERNLSVLRHIQAAIPASNRWYPVFQRYVGELADRIRAVGGNPDDIAGAPTGNGNPLGDHPPPVPCPDGHGGITGKIAELHYGCFGDFQGFTLQTCESRHHFPACERGLEELLRKACRDNAMVTVRIGEDPKRPVAGIIITCC